MEFKKLIELVKEAQKEMMDMRQSYNGINARESLLLSASNRLLNARISIESAARMEEDND